MVVCKAVHLSLLLGVKHLKEKNSVAWNKVNLAGLSRNQNFGVNLFFFLLQIKRKLRT